PKLFFTVGKPAELLEKSPSIESLTNVEARPYFERDFEGHPETSASALNVFGQTDSNHTG
ncbi:MAG: hypothetical protein VXY93_02780, partial [Pseudomonadota bacterium]|nr:hypothetical protein [Pseudomonadota bacterium]